MNFQSAAMASADPQGLDLVRRRLSSEVDLQPQDIALLDEACVPANSRAEGSDLTHQAGPLFLTSGWACRLRELGSHGRQILGFVLPGDAIGLRDGEPEPGYRTLALTRVFMLDGTALESRLRAKPDSHRNLASALLVAERAEHHRHLDHTVRLGALGAYDAMRHFLLELHDRLQAVGLARRGRFDLPVAQYVLGDALGISEVHANRVLAQMRREGLLELGPGWAQLAERA